MQVDELLQALKDCDCSEEVARKIATLVEQGNKALALEEIALHRKSLLDTFHRCDSCISRIDYIANKIEIS